jgi:hypothetical protein
MRYGIASPRFAGPAMTIVATLLAMTVVGEAMAMCLPLPDPEIRQIQIQKTYPATVRGEPVEGCWVEFEETSGYTAHEVLCEEGLASRVEISYTCCDTVPGPAQCFVEGVDENGEIFKGKGVLIKTLDE